MHCGIAYPTCWSVSRRLRVSCSGDFDRALLKEKKAAPRRLWRIPGLSVLASATLLFSSQLALAQLSQQGPKLVGAGGIVGPGPVTLQQGNSVSLSSDGNTAIVGGPGDDNGAGAAWVFTRISGVWPQQ
jgi:hypothetical protein